MRFSALLKIVLLLSALAAGAVVFHLHFYYPENQGVVGRPLLSPDYLDKVGIVHIEGLTQSVTLRRRREAWSIDEQDGFPANIHKLNKLLILLTGVRISQKVKVRPERLGDFGLLRKVENNWKHEKDRTARVLTLTYGMESRDRLIYRLLIGKHRRGGKASGSGSRSGPRTPGHEGTYIRFPSTNSVYLVTDPLLMDTAPEAWIDSSVFDPSAALAIRSVRWRHGAGSPAPKQPAGSPAPKQPAGSPAPKQPAGSPAPKQSSGSPARVYRAGPGEPWQVRGAGSRPIDPASLVEALAGIIVVKALPVKEFPVTDITVNSPPATALPPEEKDAAARQPPLRVDVSFFDGRIHDLMLWLEPSSPSRARAELSAILPVYGAPEELRERVRRFNDRFSGRQVLLGNVPAF